MNSEAKHELVRRLKLGWMSSGDTKIKRWHDQGSNLRHRRPSNAGQICRNSIAVLLSQLFLAHHHYSIAFGILILCKYALLMMIDALIAVWNLCGKLPYYASI